MSFLRRLPFLKRDSIVLSEADGPTAVFAAKGKKPNKKWRQAFLDYATTKIQANFRAFSELDSFLKSQYGAEAVVPSERKLATIKANIIVNCYPEVLSAFPMARPASPEEYRAFAEQVHTRFEEAKKIPSEQLDLNITVYKLLSEDAKPTFVVTEANSQYFCVEGSVKGKLTGLTAWQGVSQEDIDTRSLRFIQYANTLKETNKLPFVNIYTLIYYLKTIFSKQ